MVAYSDAGHSAEVYKWVDEDGKVYFSDSPPPDIVTEKIKPPPAPSEDDIRRTQARTDLLVEQQKVSAVASHYIHSKLTMNKFDTHRTFRDIHRVDIA